MIVHDLRVVGLPFPPREAESPLIVDPDAVLPRAIRLERFQAVARRNSKVFESPGRMKVEKLAARDPLDGPEAPSSLIAKESLGVPAAERSDQCPSI